MVSGQDLDLSIYLIFSLSRSYDLRRTLASIRPGYVFDVSCAGSVPESFICFLEANSYEDTVRNAISLGGAWAVQGRGAPPSISLFLRCRLFVFFFLRNAVKPGGRVPSFRALGPSPLLPREGPSTPPVFTNRFPAPPPLPPPPSLPQATRIPGRGLGVHCTPRSTPTQRFFGESPSPLPAPPSPPLSSRRH